MMNDMRGLRFFISPTGAAWQPRWCKAWRGHCTVMAAMRLDGSWHYFRSFVTEAEARWWQETQDVRI